jgi:hypothetical protein
VLAVLLALGPLTVMAAALAVARRLDPVGRAVLLLACAAFALAAVTSPVSFIHDHFTHFRHARAAWTNPLFLLDPWDRPAFMLLYAGPAHLGLGAARLVSLLPAAIAVAATMLAAHAAGLRPAWLAGVFVAAQYDVFGQASSTMTELLLAAAMAVACWAFFDGRPRLAALALGVGGLTRPEAPLLVGCCALVLAAGERGARERLRLVATVAAPFVVWVVLGSALHRDLLWFVHGNGYRDLVGLRLDASQVLRSYFYEALWLGQPLPLLLLELAGVLFIAREGGRRAAFLLLPAVALWALLTFLRIGPEDWWRQPRYTVSIAPVLALLALDALDAFEAAIPRLARPLLLGLAAFAAADTLARAWRPDLPPGSRAIPAIFAAAVLVFAAAWGAGRRVSAGVALSVVLALPLVLAPPGTFGHHRPTPSERFAEVVVPWLAARRPAEIPYDHGSLEQVCAWLVGDPADPCPLPLVARTEPAPGDTLFVKQYDGTWSPPDPPAGWRETWKASGPRVEGPLQAPVRWTTTTMVWERPAPVAEPHGRTALEDVAPAEREVAPAPAKHEAAPAPAPAQQDDAAAPAEHAPAPAGTAR